MNNIPAIFQINPSAHFMEAGSVAFIPGWIILLITIITLALLFPKLFSVTQKLASETRIFNPHLLAFILGSLMPVFDDLLTFIFGPPFAHHSLFHSFIGTATTYFLFRIIATREAAKYAFFGNLYHILFNFYLDYVTFFFPFSYREFGLTDIIRVSTYWLKAIHYPIILLLFVFSIVRYFRALKSETIP